MFITNINNNESRTVDADSASKPGDIKQNKSLKSGIKILFSKLHSFVTKDSKNHHVDSTDAKSVENQMGKDINCANSIKEEDHVASADAKSVENQMVKAINSASIKEEDRAELLSLYNNLSSTEDLLKKASFVNDTFNKIITIQKPEDVTPQKKETAELMAQVVNVCVGTKKKKQVLKSIFIKIFWYKYQQEPHCCLKKLVM